MSPPARTLPAVAFLALLLCGLSGGCSAPRVYWKQKVRINGKDFVFARLDSLKEGAAGQRVEYREGDFLVEGAGMVAVNGFEITVTDEAALLANQRVELGPGDVVQFDSDMGWKVRPASR